MTELSTRNRKHTSSTGPDRHDGATESINCTKIIRKKNIWLLLLLLHSERIEVCLIPFEIH